MKIYALGFLLILGVIQARDPLMSSRIALALDHLVHSEVLFAQKFGHAIYTYNNNTNVVCSPLSSYLLLGQATFGADDNTAEQLREVLGLTTGYWLGWSLNSFRNLRRKLQAIKDVKLYTANKLIIYKSFESNEYRSLLMKYYFNSEIETFNGSAADLADNINSWVDSKTNHTIKKIINPDAIDEQTNIILLNAVYFNAQWQYPFDERRTASIEFTDLNGNKHNVSTMRHEEYYLNHGKLQSIDAHYIELPYNNSDFKMVIIVHNKDNITEAEFNELGDLLKNNSYKELPKKPSESSVNVNLPKFKIESQIDLEPVLKAMNASEMFTNKANFKKLSENEDVDLQVTNIFQKVVINVNEKGTEAGAVSFMEVGSRMGGQAADEIYVNVPFYFLIESSQGVIFQGRVLLPHYE